MDWIIMIPQGLGAIIGFVQMFICLVVPSGEKVSSVEIQAVQPVEEVTDVDVEATASMTLANVQSKAFRESTSNEDV